MEIVIKCPPPKGTSFIEFSMNGFKETTVNPSLNEKGKHFPFIYGLPHSSKGILFSFSLPFSLLFNFFLTPALLAAKVLVIAAQIGLLLAFVMLELGIAFLQAYVFIILTAIYINDSLQLH